MSSGSMWLSIQARMAGRCSAGMNSAIHAQRAQRPEAGGLFGAQGTDTEPALSTVELDHGCGSRFTSGLLTRCSTVSPFGSRIWPRNAPSKVSMPTSTAVTWPLIQSRRIE